ncbi:MAG: CGNR zinc finger domain-containing protein [Candidatus Methylomirabilota bacterium]
MMNTHPRLDPPDPGLKWALGHYAEYGVLPFEWPNAQWRKEAEDAISGFRFCLYRQPMQDPTGRIFDTAKLAWKYFGPAIGPDKLKGPAYWWLALAMIEAHGIAIRRCPVEKCRRFFTDPKNRGKTACSPKCGSLMRARAHYEKIKSKPRTYHAYKKKQAALMRARRAAGLA